MKLRQAFIIAMPIEISLPVNPLVFQTLGILWEIVQNFDLRFCSRFLIGKVSADEGLVAEFTLLEHRSP